MIKNRRSFVLACVALLAMAGCRHRLSSLRVAYFPNLTHAAMVVGVASGRISSAAGVPIQTSVQSAGPAAIDSLLSRNVDIAFVGPIPALSAFTRSKGEFVIVSGAAEGGSALVISKRSGLKTVADLKNSQVATPQMGNTQDVTARGFFGDLGFASYEHGGNFQILPMANSEMFAMFQDGVVHAAWTVEPWATQLMVEGEGAVLIDEFEAWGVSRATGPYTTVVVVARRSLIKENPEVLADFLRQHAETTDWINQNPGEAQRIAEKAISRLTHRAFAPGVFKKAWDRVRFSTDVSRASLEKYAYDAVRVGFLSHEPVDFDNLVDVRLLKATTKASPRS